MVLSLDYWEQTGNALKNLFDLQCWASTVNISKVVMPAIEVYGAGVFHLGLNKKSLAFADLFDLDHWNTMSQELGYSALVTQQYFLERASRHIVYVRILYPGTHLGCQTINSLTDLKLFKSWYRYLTSKGFFISTTVCIDVRKAISKEEFQQKILESTSGDVTILFSKWEGIRSTSRVALSGSRCTANLDKVGRLTTSSKSPLYKYATSNSTQQVVPSKHILSYIHQFLSKYIPEKRYIAVMLRTEKLFRNNKYKAIVSRPPDNNPCASDIISDWKKMVTKSNLSKTLFVSDIGSHGSMRWSNSLALKFSRYIEDMFQPELTLSDINSILEKITGSKDSVQIAVLQQQLVAHATCVLVVGGGTFQGQTFNMYAHNHKGRECYTVKDEACKTTSLHF